MFTTSVGMSYTIFAHFIYNCPENSSVQILPLPAKSPLPIPFSVNYFSWLTVMCACMCVCVCVCVCVCDSPGHHIIASTMSLFISSTAKGRQSAVSLDVSSGTCTQSEVGPLKVPLLIKVRCSRLSVASRHRPELDQATLKATYWH